MGRARHINRSEKSGRIGAIVGTLLLIVAAVCIFLYRDRLTPASKTTETAADSPAAGETYTFETGSQQMFALMGSSLAIASTTGLQVLDGNGKSTLREVFSMTEPAVCANDDRCVFYDVGGTAIRVVSGGKSSTLTQKDPLTSVSLNSEGYLAVTGQEDGYKGCVTVYDPDLKAVYEWYSGSGYPLDAAVSPDSANLAVLTAGASGSEIHLFALNSEKETATVQISNDLAFRLHYSKNGDFCVLSQKSLSFYTPGGKQLDSFSFGSNTLDNYEFGSDMTVVALGKYVSGGSTELTSFGQDGKKLGTVTLAESPTALSSQGRKLLVLTSDSAVVYDSALRVQKSAEVTTGYISAVLLPKGDALLLSTHYAEKCEPQAK